MTMYLLTDQQAPYESYFIHGVYSSREKALEVIKNKYNEIVEKWNKEGYTFEISFEEFLNDYEIIPYVVDITEIEL